MRRGLKLEIGGDLKPEEVTEYSSLRFQFSSLSSMFSFRPYRRVFRQPLRTAHGLWSVREGFIVRCEQGGQVGFGEVAPLPDFGTETVSAAAEFLQQLTDNPDLAVPAELPCCAFGVSAAGRDACPQASADGDDGWLGAAVPTFSRSDIAALLPAGATAESILLEKAAAGYRSFKWKIGVEAVAEELPIFQRLLAGLPKGGRLRLDANAGLSLNEAAGWLDSIVAARAQVEFLEQPLAVGQEHKMAAMMEGFEMPIALDESLNGASGSKWLAEWQGPVVVKPLLMGDCVQLAERLQSIADRVVLSSVFETSVGVGNVRELAAQLPVLKYAIGFDTLDAFDDNLSTLSPEAVWNALHHSN